jgi:hypothetical protein
MNVYAEVRGKYSRNANNTVQAPGVVSRPSTSGSLVTYNRRPLNEEKKEQVEELKSQRPVASENIVTVKKKKHRETERNKEVEFKDNETEKVIENDKDLENNDKDALEDKEDYSENDSDIEKNQEENDKVTEVSFKTTSSQKRYIEELETLLKEERLRRIKAEGELQRLSSRHSKRN